MGSGDFKQIALKKIKKGVRHPQSKGIIFCVIVVALALHFSRIPQPFFDVPYATTLRSNEGILLNALIAEDEQWRFPPLDSIPEKYQTAVRLFEDEYFFYHFGINPASLARAAFQNIKAGKVISGGSTLTMQTVRMALGNKKRTYSQKCIEILKSLRVEFMYSKASIFKLYANHAPFGGNIVGLHAASWRYFSKEPHQLSWAEAATLAVLPNNPKKIFPGKNNAELLLKRNKLLDKLCDRNFIPKEDLDLYKTEPIPDKIISIPNHAFHLLQRAANENQKGKKIVTTLHYDTQLRVENQVFKYSKKLSDSEIHNVAAVVIEIDTGNTLAYIGNSTNQNQHSQYVDVVDAPRSPGSLLKPILYAAALDQKIILPKELLPDIPLFSKSFIPKNFDKKFRGVVHADQALSNSLNVPFVYLLRKFGYENFYQILSTQLGYKLGYPASHYGLSLILGSAETTLWDITAIYSGMARAYKRYFERPLGLSYSDMDFHPNYYHKNQNINHEKELKKSGVFDASALENTFKAMEQLKRPGQESGWAVFDSNKSIAWKTGTSFGFKDAWSIGFNDTYLVGVWVGNADGEARPDLVGIKSAAPLMFDVFSFLEGNSILNDQPMGEIENMCLKSGMIAGDYCLELTELYLTENQFNYGKTCTYHKPLQLNKEMTLRVNSNCYEIAQMITKGWFVLPPVEAWYYKKYNPTFLNPPIFHPQCQQEIQTQHLQLIYPKNSAKIMIPRQQDGSRGKALFHAAHQNEESQVFWHLDEVFLGTTLNNNHKMEIKADKGVHQLVLIDDLGHEIKTNFEILNE